MKKSIFYIIISSMASLAMLHFSGCSSERNSWTAKSYHNLTAHYNGYFYALEEIHKMESSMIQNHKDDYSKILLIFPPLDSAEAKGYEKEIEETVKMASIAIQRHPHSKWVDDAYILVGKARLYGMDWGNAIQTFKYVNTKSEDPDAKHKAIINLIRTFTEHQEFNNAQAAIDYLAKQKLNKENTRDYQLNKAYFHQLQNDYDRMVRSLSVASPLLKKRDRKGRIYFIIGQVYQELGFESEAFNYYKKCISTNPEYETDFYARLNMAQVAEISRSRDITAARKSFRRLLKDRRNKDFKDRIYLELGEFELKQKNIDQAITSFNQALRAGSDPRINGEAYLRLGEIYYDTLRKYELSSAYYDSAITSLPPDFQHYKDIKERQEILKEFVTHLNTITWQDSLLRLASLDSAGLRSMIDSTLAEKKRKEELANKGKKKKQRVRTNIDQNDGNLFNEGGGIAGTDWYFGNSSSVALGQTEFKRIWGDIPLADNWRRSQKIAGPRTDVPEDTIQEEKKEEEVATTNEPKDEAAAEFARINGQIPRTPEQKEEALKKIEDAYFRLGDIYYFNLKENKNAIASYNTLLNRFPESEYKPEVLYKLYLILKETDPSKAETVANQLRKEFPNSTYTKILDNPNYLEENSQLAEQQKKVYKRAYENYKAGNYVEATRLITEARNMGDTFFNPNMELLEILIVGKTGDLENYKKLLEKFLIDYPDHELTPYVSNLLKSSATFQPSNEIRKARYSLSLNGQHYFVTVFNRQNAIENLLSDALNKFNRNNFSNLDLTISELALDENYAMAIVGGIPTEQIAKDYYTTFERSLPGMNSLDSPKFERFVITNENFNILYRTKELDEYLQFFKRNYLAKNP